MANYCHLHQQNVVILRVEISFAMHKTEQPLSRAGSFLASTGLPPGSLLNDDTPVSICGFVSVSVSSVRLVPALPPLFPNSRFVGNILALKVTEQEYNIYSQSQQRPPPYITKQQTIAPRC
ncbi:putative myosin head [Trichinella spiralis]|uniref:putative myosin head n=1 Tax=Trichinella spiralis TaxID=6334 RepID=UPI0001EFC4FB|nr:putative myosin head [Trichinella spiralis]